MRRIWILFALTLTIGAQGETGTGPHGDTTPVVQAGGDAAAPAGVFAGKEESSWGFEGAAPTVMIFNDSWYQRSVSSQINGTVYGDETDERLKKRLYKGPGLRAGIDGVTLKKVKGKPGEVQVDIVGPVRIVHIPETISLRDLEGGKSIEVTFPPVGRYFAGIGSAKGGGKLKFHYDKEKGAVVMDRFDADFTFSFATTSKDSGVIVGPTNLGRTSFDYRPDMEGKYLLKE